MTQNDDQTKDFQSTCTSKTVPAAQYDFFKMNYKFWEISTLVKKYYDRCESMHIQANKISQLKGTY